MLRHYDADVVKLYPQINRQKGTLKVEVRLLERDEALRPDSSVRISFLAEAPKREEGAPPAAVVTVPKAAVREGGIVGGRVDFYFAPISAAISAAFASSAAALSGALRLRAR